MRELERVKEFLRLFVDTQAWDYGIIWKLGDDPSRFIEWAGCCCSGSASGGNVKVKTEKLGSLCRDDYYLHPIRTKACQLLSHFPLSMPLYSGKHGEVVMSKSPMWINHNEGLDSKPRDAPMGTRVFVPLYDGLIELFSLRDMPPDKKIMELVRIHCNFSLGPRPITIAYSSTNLLSFDQQLLFDPSVELSLQTSPLLTQAPPMQHLIPVTRSDSAHLSLDGSSSISNPSSENLASVSNFRQVSRDMPLQELAIESCSSKRLRCSDSLLSQQETGLVSDHTHNSFAKSIEKANQDLGRIYRSKNLVTERNRRNRINNSILTLRSLVPNISKMDKAATLGDAVEYIEKLQREVRKLQDELRGIDEENNRMNFAEVIFTRQARINQRSTTETDHRQDCYGSEEDGSLKMNLEVNQISKRDFLIRITSENRRSSFRKLMEAVHILELEIVDANVMTFSGRMLNILNVKASKDNMKAGRLKEALVDMLSAHGI